MEGREIRKDLTFPPVHGFSVLNDMERQGEGSPQEVNGPGPSLGLEFREQTGSTNAGPRGGEEKVGGDVEGLEVTSMDFVLLGVDEANGGGGKKEGTNIRPDLKTWKRMARNAAPDGAVIHSKYKAKRERNEPKENKGADTERQGKRSKQAMSTQDNSSGKLAVAITQPCQEQ